jgi:cytoskeleton protein RodZ
MTEETNETLPTENTPPIESIETFQKVQSIGEVLRSKREEKGLSLKTISQQTKIHIGLLEHLENNELTKLPSKTYVRGFVKSAAKILGLNQEETLQILEATYNRDIKIVKKEIPNYEMRNETARNTLSSMAATPLETVKSVTASSTAFLAKVVVGVLVVGVIGFNVKNLMERSTEEQLKLPQVLSTIHKRMKSPAKVAVVAPKPTATETTTTSPMQVNIIEDKKETNQKAELTINDVSLKNISLGEKQFTEDTSLSSEKVEELFPSRYKVQVAKGVENVFINASEGDSWITYKVDDKEIKKFVLRQGRTVFLRGEKIRLFLGNTKSLKLFYNNKPIALNAKTSVKNLVFPEEMKTKFMSPLFVFQKDGSVLTSEDYIKANPKEQYPPVTTTPSPSPVKASVVPAKTPMAPAAQLTPVPPLILKKP